MLLLAERRKIRYLALQEPREICCDIGVLLDDGCRISEPRLAEVAHDELHLAELRRRLIHDERVAVLQQRLIRRRQARVDRHWLLIARGQLIDGREPVVVEIERSIARIELDADAALAPQMLLDEMELLRQLRHVEDLAVEPDAVGQERRVSGLELLDGQIAHDDAVHHAAHPVLLEQVVGAVLVLCRLGNLVKIGICRKVKMCIDNFHRLSPYLGASPQRRAKASLASRAMYLAAGPRAAGSTWNFGL